MICYICLDKLHNNNISCNKKCPTGRIPISETILRKIEIDKYLDDCLEYQHLEIQGYYDINYFESEPSHSHYICMNMLSKILIFIIIFFSLCNFLIIFLYQQQYPC